MGFWGGVARAAVSEVGIWALFWISVGTILVAAGLLSLVHFAFGFVPFLLAAGLLGAGFLCWLGRRLWLRHRTEPVPRK